MESCMGHLVLILSLLSFNQKQVEVGAFFTDRRRSNSEIFRQLRSASRPHFFNNNARQAKSDIDAGSSDIDISIKSYRHKHFKLTYMHKRASVGREKDRPIILIHPVGIGLSSWFWTRVMESYIDGPAIYAPDLIGCGLDHGASPWIPNENGLFFPLSWVEGVEELINSVVIPQWEKERQPTPMPLSGFFGENQRDGGCGCLVVAQGGLAPVGIMLAKRNPLHVGALMLASPPTYRDITTAIPEKELQRNYSFLCSPTFGGLAFAMLESRSIIKFFSNLFLFQDYCCLQWLDEIKREVRDDARAPVQAFNAGLLQHRSFEDDLKEMSQPLLVVSGEDDKRVLDRQLYLSELNKKCTLTTIDGLNVVPWENPVGVVDLVKELGY